MPMHGKSDPSPNLAKTYMLGGRGKCSWCFVT